MKIYYFSRLSARSSFFLKTDLSGRQRICKEYQRIFTNYVDVVSSVAYATEEILIVLVPALGLLAFRPMEGIAWAIVGLLAILTFSYRQTIEAYPNGGGAYIVACDNLGPYAGVAAGAALAIDYILTGAVNISSGIFNIASAFPMLLKTSG